MEFKEDVSQGGNEGLVVISVEYVDRSRAVDQEKESFIFLFKEFLDVVTIGSAVQLPVNPAQIVKGLVLTNVLQVKGGALPLEQRIFTG